MADYIYKHGNRIIKFDRIKYFYQNKDVSVILPTYNEEEGINKMILEIKKALRGKNFEIVIVDDNSKDKTPEIIDTYNDDSIVALHRFSKKGIFSAIRDGIKVSRGNIIVTMDADFSHPPEKIREMLKYTDKYDIVSCSRFIEGGDVIAPFFQKYSTILLNRMLRLFLFDLKVTDFTGGFHAMKRDKFMKLSLKYNAVWGEFDMELFYRARNKGYKIKEIPFIYKYREEGKSKSENYLKYAYYYWKMALQLRLFG